MDGSTIVGILGGVASGKTAVARLLEELGALVLDADRLGREALRDTVVRANLVDHFGESILGDDGEVDRTRLADTAFGPPSRTEGLNRIVHPAVLRRLQEESARAEGPVVLDAALLLEGGLLETCDLVIFVSASEARREARARSRGWPEGERARREESQAGLVEKRKIADVEVDNDGPLDVTREQVKKIFFERIVPAAGG
ncbi:MAG: dephospho-CoA kinase [Planctomycetota bacterium]|jgi:dephospho-CoA kinase